MTTGFAPRLVLACAKASTQANIGAPKVSLTSQRQRDRDPMNPPAARMQCKAEVST